MDAIERLTDRIARMEQRVENIETAMRADREQHNEMADMLENMNAVLVEFREVINAYKTIQNVGRFVAWAGNGAKWLVQTAVALALIWVGFKLAVSEPSGQFLQYLIDKK